MIDPDETVPLLLELKAEWMEKEKIPRKKLKLAEMINKKTMLLVILKLFKESSM